MNDLTPHHRDILMAMLQGRDIEMHIYKDGNYEPANLDESIAWLLMAHDPSKLRVAPNQDEAVRLYGVVSNFHDGTEFHGGTDKSRIDTHYIDISPNGVIVGGKIEDIAK